MRKSDIIMLLMLGAVVVTSMGMSLLGVKAISRDINEEVYQSIKVCEMTDAEVVKMLRKPTDDFKRTQGKYTVYIYKGYTGYGGFDKQTLEIMLNEEGIVVDKRLNGEEGSLMTDRCL